MRTRIWIAALVGVALMFHASDAHALLGKKRREARRFNEAAVNTNVAFHGQGAGFCTPGTPGCGGPVQPAEFGAHAGAYVQAPGYAPQSAPGGYIAQAPPQQAAGYVPQGQLVYQQAPSVRVVAPPQQSASSVELALDALEQARKAVAQAEGHVQQAADQERRQLQAQTIALEAQFKMEQLQTGGQIEDLRNRQQQLGNLFGDPGPARQAPPFQQPAPPSDAH